MNRRTFLSVLPVAATLRYPDQLLDSQRPSTGSRQQFLDACARAKFWYGLGLLPKAIGALRPASKFAEAYGTAQDIDHLTRLYDRYEKLFMESNDRLEQLLQEEASTEPTLSRQMQIINLLLDTGQPWEAIARCWRTLERFPDTFPENIASLYNKLGFSYYYLGEHWEALRMVDKAFELVPKDYPPNMAWAQRSISATFLEYKILYLCARGGVAGAEQAVRTWVHDYGYKFEWLPAPHRYALGQLGIGVDAIVEKLDWNL